MRRLLGTTPMLAVGVLTVAMLASAQAVAGSGPSAAAPAGVGKPTAVAQAENYARVIVMLKGLEAGAEWAERIAAAQARVLRALAGHHVEINRQYNLTPALALTVDSAALQILRTHPDVASVSEDGVSAPLSGPSAPPRSTPPTK